MRVVYGKAHLYGVRFEPCVERLRVVKGLSQQQRWSRQPCVRPLYAAHMAAGHNALRGSGPGQHLAFDNALAQMGCPDHRIDRFCIICCQPFPTVSHAVAGTIASKVARPDSIEPMRLAPYNVRPWPSSPKPCAQACWPAQWRRLSSVGVRAACQATVDALHRGSSQFGSQRALRR